MPHDSGAAGSAGSGDPALATVGTWTAGILQSLEHMDQGGGQRLARSARMPEPLTRVFRDCAVPETEPNETMATCHLQAPSFYF